MKIVQALEDSNTLSKRITKAIENETKEQKGGFWGMLLGTLGNMLTGNKKSWLWIQRSLIKFFFLIPAHPLINFGKQKYYQNEPRFRHIGLLCMKEILKLFILKVLELYIISL